MNSFHFSTNFKNISSPSPLSSDLPKVFSFRHQTSYILQKRFKLQSNLYHDLYFSKKHKNIFVKYSRNQQNLRSHHYHQKASTINKLVTTEPGPGFSRTRRTTSDHCFCSPENQDTRVLRLLILTYHAHLLPLLAALKQLLHHGVALLLVLAQSPEERVAAEVPHLPLEQVLD